MLRSGGCRDVIVGHWERRVYFHETNETVNKQIFSALEKRQKPIVCVGETLSEREKTKSLMWSNANLLRSYLLLVPTLRGNA
ncbi:MAG: hypothetical protein GY765_39570 [bacterium]|nr:hypothetical protein [bacterium]